MASSQPDEAEVEKRRMSTSTPVQFSAESHKQIDAILTRYPEKMAALLPVLHLAQEQFGYLSSAVIDLVADKLGITASHVYGTATFYDMFRFEPQAKHEIIICRNISCYLNGCDQLKDKLKKDLNIQDNGRSTDGNFTLIEAECLAACDKAPVLMVDHKLLTHVHDTPAELKAMMHANNPAPVKERA